MDVARLAGYDSLIEPDLERVHASVYYDQRIFDEEMQRIWHRVWLYVGHESEVPTSGDYVTKTLAGEPVILSRDEHDEIHVLVNRCPHRGNTVCQDAAGNASNFRCAYHGWSFANDGTLIGATYAKSYGPDFSKADLPLARLPRTDAYRGFIFASFAAEGPTLLEQLAGAASYIDHFVDLAPEGRVDLGAGALKVRFHGNWKMPLENAVDGYHAVFLHRSVIAMNQKVVSTDEEGVPASARNPRLANRHRKEVVTRDLGNGNAMLDFTDANREARLDNEADGGLFSRPIPQEDKDAYRQALAARLGDEAADEAIARGMSNVAIFPNLAFVLHDVRTFIPVGPTETIVEQRPALLVGAPRSMNEVRVHQEVSSYGPAGMVGSDDTDVYERNQRAFDGRVDEWVVLQRGVASEVDEGGTRVGEGSGETSQRAIWREYRRRMLDGEDVGRCTETSVAVGR
jgi:phenylpropionate dioxygenase-like ring-hydroxylating dioxygenase large terminal subunit